MITCFNGSSKQAMTASAALLTLPGVRLINTQQWLGYRSRIDVNLRRAMPEQCNQEIVKFYAKLLNILASPAILYGEWKPISVLCECSDRIVARKWVLNKQHILATINFNNCWSQGRIICDDANIDSMTIYVLEMISDT